MGRLSVDQIKLEVEAKGFKLIDASNYTNMNSIITVECSKGHRTEVSFADFRMPSFTCPQCDKGIKFINPSVVPQKRGYRVIAFDQATENFGLSIFDNGKLVFYSLYKFSGDVCARLTKIRKFISDIVIKEWKPDFICFEDIQYQNGIITFKILAMLLGIVQEVINENDIPFEIVSPNVWRKYAGTAGKDRKTEKMLSKAVVKEKYNINVNDDVAEAILIGHYGVKIHKAKTAFGVM